MWHGFWLGVYNNSPTIQAVCAVGGLAGLLRYVFLTNKLRVASETANRAAVMPILFLEFLGETQENALIGLFRLQNLGRGPALHVKLWIAYDFVDTKQFGSFMRTHARAPMREQGLFGPDSDVQRGRTLELALPARPLRVIYVVECLDLAKGKHQFQVEWKDGKPGENKTVYALAE